TLCPRHCQYLPGIGFVEGIVAACIFLRFVKHILIIVKQVAKNVLLPRDIEFIEIDSEEFVFVQPWGDVALLRLYKPSE
ncbi:MAG: hypothetical protein AAFR37_05735, partial [Cyanobacteria bacterium J06628_3]